MNAGKIFLVGLGPGDEANMTARARAAIAQSDTVIGYTTYIKLVADLVDGKEVIRKGMTEELDRCHEALARARDGKIVSLVSSGDSGVYGMAGPTYEVLLESGWKPGDGVDVEVVPGSSAINSCAALVGAPLTHDACTISLSDLLTPWPTIMRRIEAAARADFVIALYNPKSGRRTQQIVEAQRILLQYRKPETPVALVKSAYRRRQNIEMTTLANMVESDIGMLTTVIVGNSNTFVREGLMVTPRGYANKYTTSIGSDAVRAGEQSGRSLSSGLLGWKALARQWLREHPQKNLRDAAAHFDMPFGALLQAVATLAAGEAPAPFAAQRIADSAREASLALARDWGQLRAIVRQGNGAIAELLLDQLEFSRKGDWINLITEHFHLHINFAEVQQVWLLAKEAHIQGLYCLDQHDNTVFSLLPRGDALLFDRHALSQHIALDDAVTDVYSDEEQNNDE
jgi:precorrin-3B C17-methyltransferase